MKRHIRLREFSPLTTATYIPSPEYLSRRPNMIKDRGYFVDLDNSGYLKTGNHIESKRKIMILGDSFYENLYVSQNLRISSVLELLLNANGFDYEVLNASVSGLTLLQAFNIIINKIALVSPDILIIGDLANDIYPLSYKERYWNKTRYYSNLTDYCNNDILDYELKLAGIEDQKKILKSIIYFCNEFNIKLLFTSICNLQVEDRDFFKANKKDIRLRCDIYENTKIIVEKQGISYINVTDNNEEKYLDNMQDDIHVNSSGARNVAKQIYSFLAENYDLKKADRFISFENIKGDFITAPNRSRVIYQVIDFSYSKIIVVFDIKCLSDVEVDYIHVRIFGNYKNGIDIHSKVWQQRSVFFDINKHDNSFPISFRSNHILEIKNIKLIFL